MHNRQSLRLHGRAAIEFCSGSAHGCDQIARRPRRTRRKKFAADSLSPWCADVQPIRPDESEAELKRKAKPSTLVLAPNEPTVYRQKRTPKRSLTRVREAATAARMSAPPS